MCSKFGARSPAYGQSIHAHDCSVTCARQEDDLVQGIVCSSIYLHAFGAAKDNAILSFANDFSSALTRSI
jgi:hypothetical protein